MIGFQKNKSGFTLLELLIVIAVIGLLVSIALPALLRSRVNANEASVKANLQTFSTAAESFRATQNPLTYPADMGSLTNALPAYLDSTWGTGTTATKSGYLLTYVTGTTSYALYAEPTQAGITGNNSFCVDATGVIWISATSTGAFTASPCSAGTGAATIT